MDVLEHILQSPVAFALLLGVAVLMLNRWLEKAKEENARERANTASAIAASYAQNAASIKLVMEERKVAEAAAERRERECVERLQVLAGAMQAQGQRHSDFMETKADKMAEALLVTAKATESNVAALNNLAAVLERNTAATETITTVFTRHTKP